MLHAALHGLVPLAVALTFFRRRWRAAYLTMLAGLLIDLDHLLATPIYDPGRCSVGFHPLHSGPALLLYAALLVPPRTRIFALGLWIHIALDSLDCRVTNGIWFVS